MAFFNKSRRTGTLEEVIGRHEDGTILQGEADMYVRIQKDCEKSPLHWYVWYDLSLPISYGGQSEIQIDFLLICEKGAIILEVKGGGIEVIGGRYYYSGKNGTLTPMKCSPFDQANHYKWALINNKVLNNDQLFVDYAVAFPHKEMNATSTNEQVDLSFWLWDKNCHEDDNCSFADFCESILDYARENSSKSRFIHILSDKELSDIVEILSPTLEDKSRYSQSSLVEVLKWLHVENMDILQGLSKNKRVLIEGGPGTGKTTMAKAFIKKHNGLKGLYLCQNILLQAKIKEDLVQEDLYNCEVYTYGRFIQSLAGSTFPQNETITSAIVKQILDLNNHKFYDYVIIDEAQDIADLGVIPLLNSITSNTGNGINIGSYLIFYDIEQGYNSNYRKIDELISDLLGCAAHYQLNENKRVITNKEIVRIANHVLELESNDQYLGYLKEISEDEHPYLSITKCDCNKSLSRAFRAAIKQSSDTTNTVVLVHSAFKHTMSTADAGMTLYDSLSCKPGVHILDEKDISNPDKSSIPFTSILKYKGLETHKVILVIPEQCESSDLRNFLFEVYVGITRAMMELQILTFKQQ